MNKQRLQQVLYWLPPLIVVAAAAAIYVKEDTLGALLSYDRSRILAGEYWRIVSGHLTHTNLNHLLLNGCGLTLAWALMPMRPRLNIALAGLAIIGALCGLALLLFEPQITWYRGLSGVIHALLVLGAVFNITTAGERLPGLVVLAAVVLKLYSETFGTSGSMVTELIGAPVVTEAHFWGALAGAAVAILLLLGTRFGQAIARPVFWSRAGRPD
ncbi:rhombosortase [Microbulbifer hydrolyticus]|uniref:Rhomboid family GlyGly-CTERM serine protease n=1 Tax=Microbulbifer hydrolyticus TaxID=48074 RepID=A0A6P1T9D7_9GAMM|nr:rhombosortase [Microbulbifer hydrolyticus]MBB5210967.1 rhomboid family GlyGly-CTERM serine protease [Microbulbifer hydrolyticus]QHQ38220.1 rhombosortase [Microbulbifer hydrolyticus]